jgi:hypothetical protein
MHPAHPGYGQQLRDHAIEQGSDEFRPSWPPVRLSGAVCATVTPLAPVLSLWYDLRFRRPSLTWGQSRRQGFESTHLGTPAIPASPDVATTKTNMERPNNDDARAQ